MTKCVIQILSETSCKIEGLDLSTRKKLNNKFKFEIPGARFTPAVKLGRWDGTKNFFALGGSTYLNLLPEIIPILEEENYSIELDDKRTPYSNTFEFEAVNENSYSHICWPPGHTLEGQPIVIRDYQVSAINTFFTNPQGIQVLATGSGKTLVSAIMAHRCERYGRTIIIVPNRDLVKQTEADYKNLNLDVGVYYGGRKEYSKTHTICTWQSLNFLLKNSTDGEEQISFNDFIEGVSCIMVDECHGAKADILLSMMTSVMAHIPIRWGFTGTIPKEKFEQVSLLVSIGEVFGEVTASELQDKGVLAKCHIHIKQLIDYVEHKAYQDELKYLLSNTGRLEYIANRITEISKTGNTLVLVDRIEPGKTLTDLIPGAVFINGSTKNRKDHYDSISTSDQTITVATYGVAAVGINIPRIFNLVLIEPGKSFVRVIQSIGRGLRIAEDKDYVDLYDFTSTCKFAKRHLTKRKAFYNEAKYNFSIEKIEWQQTKLFK